MKTPALVTILTAALTLPLIACKDSEKAREKAQVDKIFGSLTSTKIKGHEKDKSANDGK